MGADFWIVLQWWGTLFLVGAVAYPLTKRLFGRSNRSMDNHTLDPRVRGDDIIKDGFASHSLGEGWWDGGYLFSKAVGMATVTWIVFVMGTLRVMPFSVWSIAVALGVVFILGLVLQLKTQNSKLKTITQHVKNERHRWIPAFAGMTKNDSGMTKNDVGIVLRKACTLVLEELFFLAALLFWSWVKGHEPSIRGLEKFMDYGFMQSILNSQFFPPADMWYAPLSINYYYFGHMVTAVLTRLSGLDLGVTFNLMLATIFTFTLTMSFSIGYQLFKFQAPSIKSQTSTKHQMENSTFGIWNLEFVWNLRFMIWNLFAGLLTAFLVTLAGNMQTIYAFTRGYTGENVKPFWELGWGIQDLGNLGRLGGLGILGYFRVFWGKLGEGMNTYWYPNATRFIPFTIHEFPSYSFVVSDVHGHVLSIPFVLLAIALLIQVFLFQGQASAAGATRGQALWHGFYAFMPYIFYGFLVGVLLMTNALDGPIYLGLLAVVLGVESQKSKVKSWKFWGVSMVVVLFVAGLTSLPFLVHFKSFVTGVAVNCPPAMLATMKFGPILFEGVEKCQHSPLWMWWLLWGFFVFCGIGLVWRWIRGFGEIRDVWRNKITQTEKILLTFFVFALALVIVPEFIYFKDIYPAHFRSNTMFKLGYEAFILFSIVSGYAIVSIVFGSSRMLGEKSQIPNSNNQTNSKFKILNSKRLFLLFLLPQLVLVSIYPIFSVRSYFNSLKRYEGIDGLGWIRREYPDDWKAIEWMNTNVSRVTCQVSRKDMTHDTCNLTPVIVEADGDSYTDYGRFSAFTGVPTIIGWAVHEWLWRGTYDVVAPRREDVRQIYESENMAVTSALLNKYNVQYVVVGKLEREKYKSLQEWKFTQHHRNGAGFTELGREVFRAGGTVIYEVK